MQSEQAKQFSFVVIAISFVAIIYGAYKAIQIVNQTQVSTSDGIYTSYVSTTKEIEEKAYTLTKGCKSTLCKVQRLLNFTSNIPYRTNTFQQKSPQKNTYNSNHSTNI